MSVSLAQVERMSSRWYDAPDGFECVGECVERAELDDPNTDPDTVECDCEDRAGDAHRDHLESLGEDPDR